MTTKEILRVNHIPSPFFKKDRLTVFSKTDNASVSFSSGVGYDFRSTDGASAQINLSLPTIDDGEWVLSTVVSANKGDPWVMLVATTDFSAQLVRKDGTGTGLTANVDLRFTKNTDKRLMLQVRTTKLFIIRTGMQLELASTYDAAVSGGGFASSPGTPCRDRNGIRRAGGAR